MAFKAIFAAAQLLATPLSVHGNFLAINEAGKRSHGHAMSTNEITLSINASFESIMGEHSSHEAERIEASIWHSFQAMPKNELGRLTPKAVRYIVHHYFAKEHGWQLEGLEAQQHQQGNASEVHSMTILQDRAPALVEALLEDRQRGRGLSFEDCVVMIAALERLIFQESFALLQSAYALHDLELTDKISHEQLQEVLTSYLIIFRQGVYADTADKSRHQFIKQKLRTISGIWDSFEEYASDTTQNYAYATKDLASPFEAQSYSFDSAATITKELAHGYGKWQNGDCTAMKEHLMTLDKQGTGRVPLDLFYAQPEDSTYHFHESTDYLNSIGALDNSSGRVPQVRIANYVLGPTNCIARSAFYSVCCVNECENLVSTLESQVQAPIASPEQLLRMVGGMASSTTDAPRAISEELARKLRSIAERNGGSVPLHGRLFMQWLHFAFPYECPYPQQVDTAAMSPLAWGHGKATADTEEMVMHMENGLVIEEDDSSQAPAQSQWSEEEVLPLHEAAPVHGGKHASRGLVKDALYWVAHLAPILLVARAAYGFWQTAVSAHAGRSGDAKQELGLLV
eukprot:TRINITY_DN3478_c1_g1_i1.p1 TRINITY_DN3478_c1_g1~~TRINITY_DN3478_c1_g1_i1.p1  ORF type:complete len:599 (+),score=180.98 TRINITY_DN3478_c1_g1_i1:87-1799(+)